MRLHSASLHLFIEGEPDPEVHLLGDGRVAIELPGDPCDLTLEGSEEAVRAWFAAHLAELCDDEWQAHDLVVAFLRGESTHVCEAS